MGWEGCHLSEIKTKYATYGDRDIDPPDDLLDWKEFTLANLTRQGITKFNFSYDFGDNWRMTVIMKLESDLDPKAPYPVCVNGENAAPPEDVGGHPGFKHFISVMNDRKHPEFKELSVWWGDKHFDPSYFSVDEVNERL